MTTTTTTRRIQLNPIYDEGEHAKDIFWDKLRSIQDSCFRAMNSGLTFLYMKEELITKISKTTLTPTKYNKLTKDERKKVYNDSANIVKEILNKNTSAPLYRILAQEYPNFPTAAMPSVIKRIENLFSEYWVNLKLGNTALPSFKKETPIPTIKKYLNINEEDYSFVWYNKLKFRLFFGRDRSNNKAIVDNVLNETYTLCDSSIQLKDGKIFLLLVVKIPKQEVHLDEEVTVGVDLGLASSAVCALNKGYNRLSIPNSILNPRLRIQAQKRDLQKSLKYTNGGRGRVKKLSKLDSLKDKERNVVKTLNHKISHDIINFALKNNAANINLEDLKGFSKDETNSFVLRNWSYYELQTMIEQKANKWGIKVNKISPTYTSQICNCCGAKGERISQSEFKCHNNKCEIYDKKINADFNAAKNISNGGVNLTHNKETKEFFESLEYGQVVLPLAEGISTRQVASKHSLSKV